MRPMEDPKKPCLGPCLSWCGKNDVLSAFALALALVSFVAAVSTLLYIRARRKKTCKNEA
ncbi:MAG: hypothetical protein CL902_00945 [Dehalococcoidia bacterium]|nr:hypothetical protein [Dehalococcoidia bacterium]